MRTLITGAGGLLGGRLCELLRDSHASTATTRRSSPPDGVPAIFADLTDENAVRDCFAQARPDAVVHCAALADPELCEREPDRAFVENEGATRLVARECRGSGARLILVSTDLVLDGGAPFSTEGARAIPRNEYGGSKLRAEHAAIAELPDAVILRVTLLVGRGHGARRTASESLAQRLSRDEPVTLYRDEWRTPIDADSIATALGLILGRPEVKGTFNIAGAERVSRLELGLRVAARLNLDAGLIRSASIVDHRGALRAADVSLDITRARKELGWTPRSLNEALAEGRRD